MVCETHSKDLHPVHKKVHTRKRGHTKSAQGVHMALLRRGRALTLIPRGAKLLTGTEVLTLVHPAEAGQTPFFRGTAETAHPEY